MGVFARFADLLDYPDAGLDARVAACLAELPRAEEAARDAIARFHDEAVRLGVPALQELYTSAFDLDGACTLYAGHHLFGESPRRGAFMARLAEEYARSGFRAPADDLPDDLPVMLRYVDAIGGSEGPKVRGSEGPDLRDDLLADVLVPVTRRVLEVLERRGHPYALVLGALVAHVEMPA